MELLIILAICFTLLFIVEVFLGGALPEPEPGSASLHGRMKMGAFFGHALPLSALGIGIPMSVQHPWAILLAAGGVILHILVCRVMKAC